MSTALRERPSARAWDTGSEKGRVAETETLLPLGWLQNYFPENVCRPLVQRILMGCWTLWRAELLLGLTMACLCGHRS